MLNGIIFILLILLVCVAGTLFILWRQKRPVEKVVSEKPKWLDAEESPFGYRVVDCPPFTTTVLSFTNDKAVAENYLRLTKSDGKEYREQIPENHHEIVADLSYPHQGIPEDGPLFVSGCMEEKWNIYLYSGWLYFTRSWTGALMYKASIELISERIVIRTIIYDKGAAFTDVEAIYAVDFLIKSHLFRLLCVAPIPNHCSDIPEEIAPYLFVQYGNFAHYGAKGNTIQIEAEMN